MAAGTDSPQSALAPQAKLAPASAPAEPASAVTEVVSNVLAWAGLSRSLTDRPVAPVESPAMLALLAGWRRQSQQALAGKTPTNVADLPQTSQTVDPMVTGDLDATGDQGDQRALADTSTMQLSAPMSLAVAAADTTAPTVAMTAPANGARVSGTVNLTATASDDVGVVGVQFLVDGGLLGVEDTSSPYSLSVDTTGAANGNYTVTARARDAAGNTTTSAPITVTVDNTAPTVALTGPANGATVSGTVTLTATASDNVGVTGVQFKLDGANLGTEDPSSPYSVSWNTTTATNGTHTLTAVARDAAGNITTSTARTVTVNNTTADTTAPTVALTAPAAGATVSGTVTLTATASDNVGVAGVQFKLDGANLGTEDPSSPYSVSWNTTTATNGTHTLTAVARDAAGNTTTSTARTVTVNNTTADTTAPTVALTAPAAGATVSGTVTLTATASDNVGVAGVQFKLDGANLGTEDPSSPYSVSWNTTTATNGTHTLTAVARDAAGNTTTSTARTVTVNNTTADTTAPTVAMTAPANGATVSGTVNLTATASDNVGVVGVQFLVNGGLLGVEDTTADPYSVSVVTTAAQNGTYTLTARARDAAGNTTTSAPITVTVDNTAPTVALTAPAAGATVSGTVTLTATASDNVGVAGVQFKLDGANLLAEDLSSPYGVSWNTTTATNGTHTLTAVARDAAGNTTTSTARTVTVNNTTADTTAPAVAMTAPANGATVSGTVTLTATASDNVGVAGVQFLLNGANLGAEDTTSAYSVSWNTTTVTNGSYSLTARARDAAGNITTSAPVTVTVSNPDTTTSIFFGSSPRIGEANVTVMVPIVRTGDLNRVSTIEYGITPDTATAGDDYVGGNGTITMGVNVDRVDIPVQIRDDTLSEPTETFVVSIINVDSGSTILFPRTARIDILDDENPVVDPPNPPLISNYNVTQQVVVPSSSGLNQPLALEFAQAPSLASLVYVAEKGGAIKVFNVNTPGAQPSTFIDISAKVNDIQDRGLMDIALHPNFGQAVQPGQPEHNYVYAFYVVDPPDTVGNPNANARPDGGGNRFAYLVRFTANAATNYTTAVPGSEVILLGGAGRTLQDISGAGTVDSTSAITQPESGFNAQTRVYVDNYIKVDSRSHAGGSLAFGPDGALYVSIGDGTSFNTTDPRTVSVQNINSLSGKILRIDPITGLGLPDNPFVEPGDDLSANHSKVYQLGLRNPFSIGFAQDGRLLISNTGWNSWEEIESGHAGANFGWPYYEGGDNGVLLPTPGYQGLPADAARGLPSAAGFYAAVANGTITITPAYRAFAHSESAPGFQLGAIVGVDAPYSGLRYPAEFQNDVFFTDVNDGEVYVVDVNNRSDVKFLYLTRSCPRRL